MAVAGITAAARVKEKETDMWYFAWMLGLPLAALFAVLNAMWLEMRTDACFADEGDCPVGDHQH